MSFTFWAGPEHGLNAAQGLHQGHIFFKLGQVEAAAGEVLVGAHGVEGGLGEGHAVEADVAQAAAFLGLQGDEEGQQGFGLAQQVDDFFGVGGGEGFGNAVALFHG